LSTKAVIADIDREILSTGDLPKREIKKRLKRISFVEEEKKK